MGRKMDGTPSSTGEFLKKVREGSEFPRQFLRNDHEYAIPFFLLQAVLFFFREGVEAYSTDSEDLDREIWLFVSNWEYQFKKFPKLLGFEERDNQKFVRFKFWERWDRSKPQDEEHFQINSVLLEKSVVLEVPQEFVEQKERKYGKPTQRKLRKACTFFERFREGPFFFSQFMPKIRLLSSRPNKILSSLNELFPFFFPTYKFSEVFGDLRQGEPFSPLFPVLQIFSSFGALKAEIQMEEPDGLFVIDRGTNLFSEDQPVFEDALNVGLLPATYWFVDKFDRRKCDFFEKNGFFHARPYSVQKSGTRLILGEANLLFEELYQKEDQEFEWRKWLQSPLAKLEEMPVKISLGKRISANAKSKRNFLVNDVLPLLEEGIRVDFLVRNAEFKKDLLDFFEEENISSSSFGVYEPSEKNQISGVRPVVVLFWDFDLVDFPEGKQQVWFFLYGLERKFQKAHEKAFLKLSPSGGNGILSGNAPKKSPESMAEWEFLLADEVPFPKKMEGILNMDDFSLPMKGLPATHLIQRFHQPYEVVFEKRGRKTMDPNSTLYVVGEQAEEIFLNEVQKGDVVVFAETREEGWFSELVQRFIQERSERFEGILSMHESWKRALENIPPAYSALLERDLKEIGIHDPKSAIDEWINSEGFVSLSQPETVFQVIASMTREKEFPERVEELIAFARQEKEIPAQVAGLIQGMAKKPIEEMDENQKCIKRIMDQMYLEVDQVKSTKRRKSLK